MLKSQKQSIKLPKSIQKQWSISRCLSINKNSKTYLLEGNQNNASCILKSFTNHSFSRFKFRKVSHFPDNYFVLPYSHCYYSNTHFVFYQRCHTLRELLCDVGLSLSDLYSLGIDLTYAAEILIKHHFLEIDINPNNIYQKDNGHFCLGDLNLQPHFLLGTPGYLAPEFNDQMISIKKITKEQFDKAVQYSICTLLHQLCMLEPSIQTDSLQSILNIGLQKKSENRFSSLSDFRNTLLSQKNLPEIKDSNHLIQITQKNHPFFQVKTIPFSSKYNLFTNLYLWIPLIIAGCFFLISLYHYQRSSDKISFSSDFYLSQIPDHKEEDFITTTPEFFKPLPTNSILPISENTEINIQNYGLTSISSCFSDIPYPEKITCIYAGGNRFTEVSSINRFPHIKEVYLNNNQIQTLSEFSTLKQLEILVLSYNQLKEIPVLSHLKCLTHLDVSSNPDFSDVDTLFTLKRLSTLNISNTSITKKQYQKLHRKLPNCNIIY